MGGEFFGRNSLFKLLSQLNYLNIEGIDLFVKILSKGRRKEGRISLLRSASASSSHLKISETRTLHSPGLIPDFSNSEFDKVMVEKSGMNLGIGKFGVEKFRVEMFFNLSFIARWISSSSFFLKISDFSYSCWLRRKA